MTLSRLLKLAVAVATAAVLAGSGMAAAGTGPVARQAGSNAATGAATVTTAASGYTTHTINGNAPLFISGYVQESLPRNDKIHVSCWYYGNPPTGYLGDGYQDHVTYENWPYSAAGHIPDAYVDLGGHTPNQVGIPKCK